MEMLYCGAARQMTPDGDPIQRVHESPLDVQGGMGTTEDLNGSGWFLVGCMPNDRFVPLWYVRTRSAAWSGRRSKSWCRSLGLVYVSVTCWYCMLVLRGSDSV